MQFLPRAHPDAVDSVLERGAERAATVAAPTLSAAYKAMGLFARH